MKYIFVLFCTLILVACADKTTDKPIASSAVIEFRAASFSPEQGYTEMLPSCIFDQLTQKVYVSEQVLLSNADIASAKVAYSKATILRLVVGLLMTESGKTKLAQVSEQNLNKPIAILVNKQLMGSLVVVEKVTNGKVMISCIAMEEAEHMALEILSENNW